MGIRLPVELVDALDRIAKAHQVSRTALIRFALAGFVGEVDAGRIELPTRTVTITDI